MTGLRNNLLWQDLCKVPETLERTLAPENRGQDPLNFLKRSDRIVVTGNGASYYAAQMMTALALESASSGPCVVAVPSGVLAASRFEWRSDDALLVISSSGELRDIVELISSDQELRPYCAVTAHPESTIGANAACVARIYVDSQEAVTHTQAFIGSLGQVTLLWTLIVGDKQSLAELGSIPERFVPALVMAEEWGSDRAPFFPKAAIALGMGPARIAASEAALLLREVALVPSEGMDTREGATTGMYSLTDGHLVVTIASRGDRFMSEAQSICRKTGATVIGIDVAADDHPLAVPFLSFPKTVALSAAIGLFQGLDIARPSWTEAYYQIARVANGHE